MMNHCVTLARLLRKTYVRTYGWPTGALVASKTLLESTFHNAMTCFTSLSLLLPGIGESLESLVHFADHDYET